MMSSAYFGPVESVEGTKRSSLRYLYNPKKVSCSQLLHFCCT